ncbi:MAG: threonylcarbamoyl-AMP synthase [Candidatus Liberibacter europaeus]|uniref:Threonylcarbamoyl-AMP synthase n=1 Tax=Candidatus Liberibacter europaeus TaxID=744859 RepID=A0A2T4VZ41_9HYPH|nr:threonylcarbamoyl-AMP synthase [Candidatus Liberibacter europaeus]PTL87041.1 MAG: threonylcarbamoyl-AMP synthase [Candidatus Liberibacter europaeus]
MTQIMSTKNPNALWKACELLESGLPIVIPTETVYGIAVDARNPSAIRRLYEIKNRPPINPLICHVSSIDMTKKYAFVDSCSLYLSQIFWPGPLTLLLDLIPENDIHPLTTSNLKTACFRVPCGFARNLIATYGYPLAMPSANISGQMSLTNAKNVLSSSIGKEIPLILDGGDSEIGLESTIIQVKDDQIIQVLRPGGLEIEEIKRVTGKELTYPIETSNPQAPGMLKSHYAPRAQVRLQANHVNYGEALIRFANFHVKNIEKTTISLDLSPSGNLKEAAFNLFNYMKIADESCPTSIAFTPIPNHGLGIAINNRLERAAAPRQSNATGKII